MDSSKLDLKQLLRSFLIDAVGIELLEELQPKNPLPPGGKDAQSVPDFQSCWQSERGSVIGMVTFHAEHSARTGAWVLFFEWWIGSAIHRAGFYYCYPKRPREWIKGVGR